MSKHIKAVIGTFLAVALAACNQPDVHTLYRNSVLDPLMRIHVATFDAKDGKGYNSGNCEIVRSLLQEQEGVTTRYWCEKGRYKT